MNVDRITLCLDLDFEKNPSQNLRPSIEALLSLRFGEANAYGNSVYMAVRVLLRNLFQLFIFKVLRADGAPARDIERGYY